MENPIKMDDLGVPIFLETPIWPCNTVGAMGHILYTLKKDQNTSRAIHDLKTTHVKEPTTNNHPATLLKLQIGFFWGSFSKSTKNMMFHRPKNVFLFKVGQLWQKQSTINTSSFCRVTCAGAILELLVDAARAATGTAADVGTTRGTPVLGKPATVYGQINS